MTIRKLIIIGGIIMLLSSLTACFSKTYTIGTDPKLEDITSVTIGGGGMEYSSSWSWSACHSERKDSYELQRVWWSEDANEMKDVTVAIDSYAYEKILDSRKDLKYVRYDPPKSVMDGYSESARIFWPDHPSGSYRIDFGERGMQELLSAMNEAWGNHAYKTNEAVSVKGMSFFSFSYGPTDLAYGNDAYTAEINETGDQVLLTRKLSGQPEEEAQQKSVTASFLARLENIVRSVGADRWDGFSGNDSWVMDGSAFSLFISTEDGNSISANGHEMYPEGFTLLNKEVADLFAEYFPPEGE